MREKLFYWSLALLLTILQACKSIAPVAPETKITEAPIAPQPSSSIVLPIEIKLSEYFKLADNQVPKTFNGSENPCDGVSYNYFFSRDPLKINAMKNKVKIDVTGKYWIKMSYCPSCTDLLTDKPICVSPRIPFSCGVGEPMRKMALQYTTKVELTEKYGIKSNTKLSDLKAIDACEVTIFNYDATGQLLKEVKGSLNDLAVQIDKDLSAINFKNEATTAWNKLGATFPVYGYGYLHLNPKKVMMLQPSLENNLLSTALIIEANPLFDHNPLQIAQNTLPDLNIERKIPTDTFQVYLDFNLRYDSLSKNIQSLLAGKSMELKGNTIIFDSIKVAGASNKELLFQLNFSGSKKGTMYLRGTPVFNREQQTVELTKVDFDLETKNVLLKTAKWLFSDRILNEIQKASKQDLSKHLTDLSQKLNESLTYQIDQFMIKGKIHQINVEELHPNHDFLMIRLQTLGNLKLSN